jgi:hypothetical protein
MQIVNVHVQNSVMYIYKMQLFTYTKCSFVYIQKMQLYMYKMQKINKYFDKLRIVENARFCHAMFSKKV